MSMSKHRIYPKEQNEDSLVLPSFPGNVLLETFKENIPHLRLLLKKTKSRKIES